MAEVEVAARLEVTADTIQQRIYNSLGDIHRVAVAPRTGPRYGGPAASPSTWPTRPWASSTWSPRTAPPRSLTYCAPPYPASAPAGGVRLLLRLTGRHHELGTVRTRFLISMVEDKMN